MLPGFSAPAVGFDTPFEMLEACHERVERSLRLLTRLAEHLDRQGWDDPARRAASDVLRYFDVAAPLHHEDEERHVFPAALAAQDAAITAAVHRLQQDHQDMHRAWQAVRTRRRAFEVLEARADAEALAQAQRLAQKMLDEHASQKHLRRARGEGADER